YNCTGCHALEMDRWKLAYAPDEIRGAAPINDFAFLAPHFTAAQVQQSLATDIRGLRHAVLTGMPRVDEQGRVVRFDEEGTPLEDDDQEPRAYYNFQPWKDVLLNGQPRVAGLQNISVPESAIEQKYPPLGGYLPQLIYPAVVKYEKEINPQAKADEA